MSKSIPSKEIELHPDAWARFERAAGVVAKTPPQHRVAKKPKKKDLPEQRTSDEIRAIYDRIFGCRGLSKLSIACLSSAIICRAISLENIVGT